MVSVMVMVDGGGDHAQGIERDGMMMGRRRRGRCRTEMMTMTIDHDEEDGDDDGCDYDNDPGKKERNKEM